MLDRQFITEQSELVKNNIANRGMHLDVDKLLSLIQERKQLLQLVETGRAAKNARSKSKPTPEEIEQIKAESAELKSHEEALASLEAELLLLERQVPNMTHPNVPVGGEDDAAVLETVGDIPAFTFEPKTHEEILLARGEIDFERGAKVVGSKFYFSKGKLVRLNQAILALAMDVAEKHGFTLVETPDLAKNDILEGIGFNPRGEETQIYSIENTDLSLVGTAEITIGGYHSGEEMDLSVPVKYAALSHCYRTEAGAYGRTSRGLYRVHQFTKLELFVYCKADESDTLHAQLLQIEKEICDALELAYQVVDIATGDLGAPAYRKFDIEAYMTMKEGYGEITSTSNCTDYQSRRLQITYRNEEGARQFAHTLNGTAVTTSRTPIALIEQHQQEDGSLYIPVKLRPYLGGIEIL